MNRKSLLLIFTVLTSILLAGLMPAANYSFAAQGDQQPDMAKATAPQVNPERQPYTLTIAGNYHFSEKELLKFATAELQKFRQNQYRKADIDDAAFQMRGAYLQAGFAFASVDYTYEPKAQQIQVTFKVEEGPRVFIKTIHITGNQNIQTDILRGVFQETAGPWGRRQKMIYNESELKAAVDRVRDYYRGEGFSDVAVQSPELSFTGNRSEVDITIDIEEGHRYFIDEVFLSGDLIPELISDLEKVKKEFSGKTYYLRRKLLLRSSLEAVYDAIGYADADFEIRAVPQEKPGLIKLEAEITSGEQIRITEVIISGNSRTEESFIRDRLKFKAGDIYSNVKRRESFRALFDSGLFAKITIDMVPPDQGGRRNLQVFVEELPSREVYLAPGWGSYEELRLGVGFFEKNLFGIGRNGKIDGLISTKGENITLSYIDPWLLQTDIAMNVPLYYEHRKEPSYSSEETGVDLFFSRELSTSFTLTTGYQFKMTRLSDLSDATSLQEEDEDYNKGSVGIQTVWDTRNDIFYPTTGLRLTSGFDLSSPAFGSEIEFGRVTLGGRYFIELPREYVLGMRVRTGLIVPFRDQTFIPISERFFNGGDSTVRSYEHSQLGPKDDSNEPLGGLGYNVFSIELRKRLSRDFAATLYVDAGNVAPNKSSHERDFAPYASRAELLNDTLDDFFNDFKFGIGIGLQYLLPVGPIRIDVAYNPDPDETWAEDVWAFHFSLGMAF